MTQSAEYWAGYHAGEKAGKETGILEAERARSDAGLMYNDGIAEGLEMAAQMLDKMHRTTGGPTYPDACAAFIRRHGVPLGKS